MNFGSVMTSGPADAPEHDIRDQAAAHTLAANPLVGVRGQDIFESAQTVARGNARQSGVGRASVCDAACRARPHRNRRQRACTRSQGSPLCRSGVERECGLSCARAGLCRLGQRAPPLSGRGEYRQAQHRARAFSRLAARRRDGADQFSRRQSRGAKETGRDRRRKPASWAGEFYRRPHPQRRLAGPGRHPQLSRSARISRSHPGRSCFARR